MNPLGAGARLANWLRPPLARAARCPELAAWVGALLAISSCTPGGNEQQSVTVVAPGTGAPEPSGPDPARAPVRPPTPEDVVLAEAPPPPFCGDGALDDDEQCDDGGTEAGDGCSANCLVVEQGYACPTPGSECVIAAICGDSLQLAGELCDDGNLTAGDGCSADCQIEKDFVCPTPGEACVSSVVCGDRSLTGDEACDDGNVEPGDGCSDLCQIETGWSCPIPGARCRANCGDGRVLGLEQCDDGDTTAGDGCNATCGSEDGFVCNTPGEACVRARCGNGVAESTEGCDDGGDDVPFDGCFACVREPTCIAGACAAVCGDGLRFQASEDCDDGNTLAGDGCSPDCLLELGFDCTDQGGTGATGETFVLPVIYRDFIGLDTSGDPGAAARATARAAAGVEVHPDFNGEPFANSVVVRGDGVLGAVEDELDDNRRPVFACANPAAACLDGDGNRAFTSEARFDEWYRNVPGVNVQVIGALTLDADEDNPGAFVFDSALAGADNQFDPLLGLGWHAPQVVGNRAPAVYESPEFCDGDQVPNPDAPTTPGATPRNLSFTTETRFVFEYAGGETFQFSGDDDVWVFVNNQLVVDLGGLHNTATGEFTLSGPAPAAPGIATVDRVGPLNEQSPLDLAAPISIDTGMQYGGVYEVVMFHAERHQCGSNFKLTLAGFDKPRSVCREDCGDGELTRSESCDDGELNGSGYGFCTEDCLPGPRCGDGLVNGEEVCDNGVNLDRYSTSTEACAPGCTRPSFCGDQVVDGAFGEQCDDGVNDDSYLGCSPTCGLGPRCGDGATSGPEECDDGNRINGDGCNLACELERDVVPS